MLALRAAAIRAIVEKVILMRHAAHGATKAKRRNDSPLSLFVLQRGSHGAHGVSRKNVKASAATSAATSVAGARLTALAAAGSNGAVVDIPEAVSNRLQEILPQSRREIRLSRLASERRRRLMLSTSLITMVGAVAATMSLTRINTLDSSASETEPVMTTMDDINYAVSRSSQRESLNQMAEINNAVDSLEHAGDAASNGAHAHADASKSQPGTASTASSRSDSWSFGADSSFNIAEMSRAAADNPQVALLMDQDFDLLPKGFNANHATGDTGNAYEFSQCTWWVYVRRHQLGLPVGSHFGNGNMWADSARALGYWVDTTPRHVGDIMVFRSGQAGSDPFYGHVAIVEKINPDGSIETSESGAPLHGRTFSRKFDANQTSQYRFIHY